MATKKKKKKRQPSRLVPVVAPPEVTIDVDGNWRKIVFGDLHVKATTLVRCIAVLDEVERLAIKYDADVVCTGDFWDQRGTMSVRQHNAIHDKLISMRKKGIKIIFIPGNHDQVTRNGKIHGLRVFEPFDNIIVVTEPYYDKANKIAYLPWREEPEEQALLFKQVPKGYTVFAHGEVADAEANNGHKVKGHWSPGVVKQARAVYLGHFHKRQKIGGHIWYLGSPYEQNMGERSQPHGVALITDARIEPHFFELTDMPKHWRFTWPQDESLFSVPREQDIVEVLAAKTELHKSKFLLAKDILKAKDVRPLPLPATPESGKAPTFALTASAAIDKYTDENIDSGFDSSEYKAEGHRLFAAVAAKRAVAPLGNLIKIKQVDVDNFCAVTAPVRMPLDELGTVLLRGPMGSGKTSITDAITWCLFGTTAPRKPGASGATLTADSVINDEASFTKVVVALDVDGVEYMVSREKKRTKGAVIELFKEGAPWREAGISDQQQLIHAIVGMDYDLWRTCISLGQGEVANFVTDAQKKRTELLERAFGLAECPHAQALARKELKVLAADSDPLRHKLTGLTGQVTMAKTVNYDEETRTWENTRQNEIARQREIVEAANTQIATFDVSLRHEAGWAKRKEKLAGEAARLQDAISKADTSVKAGSLHAQIGATQAEQRSRTAEVEILRKSYENIQENKACAECGQVIPPAQLENHIRDIESKIQSKQAEMTTHQVRVQNLQSELGQLVEHGGAGTASFSVSLKGALKGLDEANVALTAVTAVKEKRAASVRVHEEARRAIAAQEALQNPWAVKQAEGAAVLAQLEEAYRTTQTALEMMEKREHVLRFWEQGFGPKGLPVLVLRTALYELEMHANAFLAKLMGGRVYTELEMIGDNLNINFFEFNEAGVVKERDYLQLSGGQRRCVQLAFVPFALSEMIFSRTGVRVPFLVIDELTTHLDPETKPIVCGILRELGRDTVLVIDHDPNVQGEFDVVYDVSRGGKIKRAA